MPAESKTWVVYVNSSIVSGIGNKGKACAYAEYLLRGQECIKEWCNHDINDAKAIWLKHLESEKRVNSRVQNRLDIPLPNTLTEKQIDKLVTLLKQHFNADGKPLLTIALHGGKKEGQKQNLHLQIAYNDRDVDSKKKIRSLQDRSFIGDIRTQIVEYMKSEKVLLRKRDLLKQVNVRLPKVMYQRFLRGESFKKHAIFNDWMEQMKNKHGLQSEMNLRDFLKERRDFQNEQQRTAGIVKQGTEKLNVETETSAGISNKNINQKKPSNDNQNGIGISVGSVISRISRLVVSESAIQHDNSADQDNGGIMDSAIKFSQMIDTLKPDFVLLRISKGKIEKETELTESQVLKKADILASYIEKGYKVEIEPKANTRDYFVISTTDAQLNRLENDGFKPAYVHSLPDGCKQVVLLSDKEVHAIDEYRSICNTAVFSLNMQLFERYGIPGYDRLLMPCNATKINKNEHVLCNKTIEEKDGLIFGETQHRARIAYLKSWKNDKSNPNFKLHMQYEQFVKNEMRKGNMEFGGMDLAFAQRNLELGCKSEDVRQAIEKLSPACCSSDSSFNKQYSDAIVNAVKLAETEKEEMPPKAQQQPDGQDLSR